MPNQENNKDKKKIKPIKFGIYADKDTKPKEINPFIVEEVLEVKLVTQSNTYYSAEIEGSLTFPIDPSYNRVHTNRPMELNMYLCKDVNTFKLLWYIVNRLRDDQIELLQDKVRHITSISKNKFYEAIKELIDKRVICKTGKNNRYWVNPHYLANTSRDKLGSKYKDLSIALDVPILGYKTAITLTKNVAQQD